MPTEKPRLSVTMEAGTLEQVNRFREEQHISTQSKAAVRLIELALEGWGQSGGKFPSLSEEALRAAQDYQRLDRWGRQVVRSVMADERERMADEDRFLRETLPEPEPKVIPLFFFPAAAGYASPVLSEDFELYELKPQDPQGAEFAVRLQGDSRAPDFPDGCTVFCNRDPLAAGDIGIFCVDSGAVCKQYCKDPAGFVYLFSLNRARSDADLLISPGGNRTLVCQGRVIPRKRYPVPGRE